MKLLLFVALLGLVAFSSAVSPDEKTLQSLFAKWMHQHNKVLESSEFNHRYETWKANYLWIEEFNKQEDVTFTVAMNEFGDLTSEEFSRLYKGLNKVSRTAPETFQEIQDLDIPASFDWRQKGVVTPVKNQYVFSFPQRPRVVCRPYKFVLLTSVNSPGVSAEAAGLSAPPVRWKEPTPRARANLLDCLSKTWLIARPPRVTTVAMEVRISGCWHRYY